MAITLKVAERHEGSTCSGCGVSNDKKVAKMLDVPYVTKLYALGIAQESGSQVVHYLIRLCKPCVKELRKVAKRGLKAKPTKRGK